MDIYIDVLFIVNLVLNYLILFSADKFLKKESGALRILMGAGLGALYSVIIVILPGITFLYSLIAKILLSILIVYITFTPRTLKTFMKSILTFYGVSFLFGGAVLGVMYFYEGSGFIKNGIIYYYWNSKWTLTVFGVAFAAIIFRTIIQITKFNFLKKNLIFSTIIFLNGRSVKVNGFVDTGNSMKEPFSGKPVIIVEFDSLKDILPIDIVNSISTDDENNDLFESITNCKIDQFINYKFRMIPFSVLGKENDMIPAIIADYVEINDSDKTKRFKNVVIGIYNKKMPSEGEYSAIIGREFAIGINDITI
jgi:stage II sporulation protein GA (sporulation sigma-E factor processing peptidase)